MPHLIVPGESIGPNLSMRQYQWKRNGQMIPDSNYPYLQLLGGMLYSAPLVPATELEGDYTVQAWTGRGRGMTNLAAWQVTFYPGMLAVWGASESGQAERPIELTNALAVAAGESHCIAVREDGTIVAWGGNSFGQTNIPQGLTNVIAVASGSAHNLALKSDGTVTSWGRDDLGQTKVPSGLSHVIAVSAGGNQSLALKSDGTVVQWGEIHSNLPAGLGNVQAIASGANFHLALFSNSTLRAWGENNHGQLNVPANLSDVVSIAAGGAHALALRANGRVIAWGSNDSGESNVPANLTNAMGIAAGSAHSVALKNDGTLAAWGDNSHGQTDVPTDLIEVKLLAANGFHTVVSRFSMLVKYPVDVTRDVLLIYNTNSKDSSNICSYYLQHRPLVRGANVLGIPCPTNETVLLGELTNQIIEPFLGWLRRNPTKHPEYVILFLDVPARAGLTRAYQFAGPPSVSVSLTHACPGWKPLITHLNMNTTEDCKAYIDKLESIGSRYSPGKLFISASAGGYGNTNFVVDAVCPGGTCTVVPPAKQGLVEAGASAQITYRSGSERETPHPTDQINVAGYVSHGCYTSLGNTYAVNGKVKFLGHSGWFVMATIESFNGRRNTQATGQGSFIHWFSRTAFGGSNYSNTPVGAVTYS